MIDDIPGPRTHRLWYPALPEAFEEERPPELEDVREVRAWFRYMAEQELAAAARLRWTARRQRRRQHRVRQAVL